MPAVAPAHGDITPGIAQGARFLELGLSFAGRFAGFGVLINASKTSSMVASMGSMIFSGFLAMGQLLVRNVAIFHKIHNFINKIYRA